MRSSTVIQAGHLPSEIDISFTESHPPLNATLYQQAFRVLLSEKTAHLKLTPRINDPSVDIRRYPSQASHTSNSLLPYTATLSPLKIILCQLDSYSMKLYNSTSSFTLCHISFMVPVRSSTFIQASSLPTQWHLKKSTSTLQHAQALHLTCSLGDILKSATVHHLSQIGPSKAGRASGHSLIAIQISSIIGRGVYRHHYFHPTSASCYPALSRSGAAAQTRATFLPSSHQSFISATWFFLSLCYRTLFFCA